MYWNLKRFYEDIAEQKQTDFLDIQCTEVETLEINFYFQNKIQLIIVIKMSFTHTIPDSDFYMHIFQI